MKNLKEQKGITLVALVVTIIVLLILAGVTILYVMSDNGIFDQAERAGEDSNVAFVKEVITQAILEAQAEHYDPANTDLTTATALTAITPRLAAAGITPDSTDALEFEYFCDDTNGTKLDGTAVYNGGKYLVAINTKTGTTTVTYTGPVE